MKRVVVFLMFFIFSASISTAKVNINTAEKNELMTLKGLGEKRVEEIIKRRSEKPFGSLEELLEIKGIGNKFIENNKDNICFGKDC